MPARAFLSSLSDGVRGDAETAVYQGVKVARFQLGPLSCCNGVVRKWRSPDPDTRSRKCHHRLRAYGRLGTFGDTLGHSHRHRRHGGVGTEVGSDRDFDPEHLVQAGGRSWVLGAGYSCAA